MPVPLSLPRSCTEYEWEEGESYRMLRVVQHNGDGSTTTFWLTEEEIATIQLMKPPSSFDKRKVN